MWGEIREGKMMWEIRGKNKRGKREGKYEGGNMRGEIRRETKRGE